MTRRVWTWGVSVLGLFAVWLTIEAAVPRPALRSRHSEPAAAAPETVMVTPDGKLYHRAGCTYMHGPARPESGTEAIAEGYTPCTRCLPRLQ